ncbi:hypothetical protein D3C85_1555260 [compost metagenome]
MSNIINVEFLAGTDIEEAVKEAKQKAFFWDVAYVCFKFNGVNMSIKQNTDVEKAVHQFHDALKNNRKFVVC